MAPFPNIVGVPSTSSTRGSASFRNQCDDSTAVTLVRRSPLPWALCPGYRYRTRSGAFAPPCRAAWDSEPRSQATAFRTESRSRSSSPRQRDAPLSLILGAFLATPYPWRETGHPERGCRGATSRRTHAQGCNALTPPKVHFSALHLTKAIFEMCTMLLFKKCFLGAWPFSDSTPRTELNSFQEQCE